MKLKRKILLTIIGLSAICIIINPIMSNAALQANGNEGSTDGLNNWLLPIRQMEEIGGTLGLSDTINITDLTSSATQANDLDIHMEKNTEYGAMAILSASAYGNQKKIESGETTTGNKSGVYINLNKEWVAASTVNTGIPVMSSASSKYKNGYTAPTYTEKVGDAIQGVQGWHDSGASVWLSTYGNYRINLCGLVRSYAGSIFSYYGYGWNNSSTNINYHAQDGAYVKTWSTRAVIVVGEGF